jgi:hypothetical protein
MLHGWGVGREESPSRRGLLGRSEVEVEVFTRGGETVDRAQVFQSRFCSELKSLQDGVGIRVFTRMISPDSRIPN